MGCERRRLIQNNEVTAVLGVRRAGCNSIARYRKVGYSWSMAKDKNKKRTAKTNKPKLTPKEKKLKKLAKKAK